MVVAQERIGCFSAILYRSEVPDLSSGWQLQALPLTSDTDDEIAPFPQAVSFPGIATDPIPSTAPLILYRVLLPGDLYGGNGLNAVKNPGGEVELHFR